MTGDRALARVVGVPGAILLGLGSIVGTGVYVSLGLAASEAGASIVLAVIVAGLVATANGLSSAALAASHPVSGGTYEYGRRYLGERWGFTAGALFLVAKSASAATAAIGFSRYAFAVLEIEGLIVRFTAPVVVLVLTALVSRGVRRSNVGNAVLVVLGLGALVTFVGVGLVSRPSGYADVLRLDAPSTYGFFEACALVFVAYTGYGRIATLGEEVRDPARTIPRAIVATLAISIVLYASVAATGVVALGAEGFGEAASYGAALEAAGDALGRGWLATVLAIGAAAAMLGVSLNLVLGLSRVLFGMARRGDAPTGLAEVVEGEPRRAVWTIGLVIAALSSLGDVRTTWSLSAFTVLVYYGITHLAATRLPKEARPSIVVLALGLSSCFGLALFVDPLVLAIGAITIALAVGIHAIVKRPRGDGGAR